MRMIVKFEEVGKEYSILGKGSNSMCQISEAKIATVIHIMC